MANTKTGPQPLAPWLPVHGSSRSGRPDGTSRRRGNPLGDYKPNHCSWGSSSHAKLEGVVKRRRKVK